MKAFLSAALALIAVALAGCTVHQTTVPGLSGPSDLALSIRVTASPDSISQDGGSQSSIAVNAFDAHRQALRRCGVAAGGGSDRSKGAAATR